MSVRISDHHHHPQQRTRTRILPMGGLAPARPRKHIPPAHANIYTYKRVVRLSGFLLAHIFNAYASCKSHPLTIYFYLYISYVRSTRWSLACSFVRAFVHEWAPLRAPTIYINTTQKYTQNIHIYMKEKLCMCMYFLRVFLFPILRKLCGTAS